MKRHNFTVTELLTVIAVIGILAGILIPVLTYARRRARQSSCVSNQGQMAKMLLASMAKNNQVFTSKASGDKLWTTYLHDKKFLQSLEEARCPEFKYENRDINSADARKEALGVVAATAGEFNFKSNKIRKDGTVDVPMSVMLMGGCTGKGDKANAVLDFSNDAKLLPVHSGAFNVFFFDGSVSSVDEDEKAGKSYYRPKADGSGAEKVTL